jgi:hypothetical protein
VSRVAAPDGELETLIAATDVVVPSACGHLLETLAPINLDEFRNSSHFSRFVTIIKVPATIVLRLFIPVVDTSKYLNGWCRLLAFWHSLVTPMIILFLANSSGQYDSQPASQLYRFLHSYCLNEGYIRMYPCTRLVNCCSGLVYDWWTVPGVGHCGDVQRLARGSSLLHVKK